LAKEKDMWTGYLRIFVAFEGGIGRIAWLALRKAISIALTVFIIASLIFSIFYIQAGDPVHRMIPRGVSPERVDQIVQDLHLNEPLHVQFFYHILDAFTFDLPASAIAFDDINDHIWTPVAFTMILFVPIFLTSLLIGWMVDRFVHSRNRRRAASVVHGTALLSLSVPIAAFFLLALKTVSEFNLRLPVHGSLPYGEELSISALPDILLHLILPALVGILASAGFVILIQRAGRMEAASDAAWGNPRIGVWKPGRRMLEYLSIVRPYSRYHIAWTMTCVLFVDICFDYGGLGWLAFESIWSADYPLLMAVFYTTCILTLVLMICASAMTFLLRRRPIAELLADWVSRDSCSGDQTAACTSTAGCPEKSMRELVIGLAKGFGASRIGLVAALVLTALAVLGLLGPVFATDTDIDSRYQLPVVRELDWGTALSNWLNSARGDVVIVLVNAILATAISVLIGVVAVKTILVTGDGAARFLDFLLTAVSRAFVAIPLTIFLFCLLFGAHLRVSGNLELITVPVMVLAWAHVFILRRVRAQTRLAARSAGRMTVSVRAMMPSILGVSFFVGKFTVLTTILAAGTLSVWGWMGDSWWGMLFGFDQYSIWENFWEILLLPMVGIVLLASSAFLVLDRLEKVSRDLDRPCENAP